MITRFYGYDGQEKIELGSVNSGIAGAIITPPSLAERLKGVYVCAPDGNEVTPADNDRYIAALPSAFRPPYFFAEIDESDQQV